MAISTKTRQTNRDAPTAAPHVASAAVLELVLLRVRLRARRRAAWLAYLAGSTRAGAQLALDPTLEVCLDHRDTLEAEAAWYARSEVVQPLNEELEQVEQALAVGDAGVRLRELCSLFRLSEPEMDLLQTGLALAIDPTLGLVYAYLQQHPGRSYATEALAARLFGYGRGSLWQPRWPACGVGTGLCG